MAMKFPGARPGQDGSQLLEYELFQERASTMARLGRRAEEALKALADFDAARAQNPNSTGEDADRRAALVDAAGEALWYYVVTREMCGLRDADAVIRELGAPREVRLRMGVFPPRERP